MANTLNLGTDGNWATKEDALLGYNSENSNYKPLPFDFERGSVATRINKEGLIETVGANEPRIDYKDDSKGSLLLEPSKTNLITQSELFSDSYWTKSGTSVVGGFASPSADSPLGAFKLLNNAVTSTHYLNRSGNSVLSGVDYTFSIFAKKGENNFITMMLQGSGWLGSTKQVSFNLLNGTFDYADSGLTYKSTLLNNGFYKIEVTNETASTSVNLRVYSSSTVNDVSSYLGDGTSGIYIFGASLEQGYATSYIPTQGGIETRLADICIKENLVTDIINASYPFTIYVEGTYSGQLSALLSFLNKDASQQFFLIYINNNEVFLSARSNGTIELIESGINLIKGQKYKIAVTMNSATSGKICVNGNSVTVKNNFSSQIQNSNITDLLIGQERIVSDGGIRSSVSGVKLYNTALTDQELAALTQV